MLYAQVGQHHLARTTETSPKRSSGTLSCLSARPHDLAFWTGTRPRVVGVSPSIVPFVYSKRAAWTRGLVSRYRRSNVLWPLRAALLAVELPVSKRTQPRCLTCTSLNHSSASLCALERERAPLPVPRRATRETTPEHAVKTGVQSSVISKICVLKVKDKFDI